MRENMSMFFRILTPILLTPFTLLCQTGMLGNSLIKLRAQDTIPRQSKRLVRSPEESPSKRKRLASKDDRSTRSPNNANAFVDRVQAQVDTSHIVEQSEPQVQMPPPRRPPIRSRRRLNVPRSPLNIDVETPRNWQRTRLDRPIVDLETIIRSPAQRAAGEKNDPKDLIALILAGVPHDESDIISVFRGAQDNISSESVRANLTAVDNTLARTIEPIAEQDSHIQEILPALANLDTMQIDNMTIQPVVSPRFSSILRENSEEINISDVALPRLHASTPKPIEVTFETAITRQKNLLDRIRKLFLDNGNAAIQIEQLCDVLIRLKISTTFSDLLYLHSKQYIRMESVLNTIQLENIYPGEKLQE